MKISEFLRFCKVVEGRIMRLMDSTKLGLVRTAIASSTNLRWTSSIGEVTEEHWLGNMLSESIKASKQWVFGEVTDHQLDYNDIKIMIIEGFSIVACCNCGACVLSSWGWASWLWLLLRDSGFHYNSFEKGFEELAENVLARWGRRWSPIRV